jgi:hypothetical protein
MAPTMSLAFPLLSIWIGDVEIPRRRYFRFGCHGMNLGPQRSISPIPIVW